MVLFAYKWRIVSINCEPSDTRTGFYHNLEHASISKSLINNPLIKKTLSDLSQNADALDIGSKFTLDKKNHQMDYSNKLMEEIVFIDRTTYKRPYCCV